MKYAVRISLINVRIICHSTASDLVNASRQFIATLAEVT